MAKEAPGGYNGKILRVNLSNKSMSTEALDDEFCRRYIGGAGFIAYYLWKELKPRIDALSPDNKLIFALGPITGLLLPGAARNCVGAKSPLTDGIAKSESGGFWMAELKRAGYDAIIVEGRAETPVYLWVHDGEASIRDAKHLWGKETKETEEAIHAELGDEHIHCAMIGSGGENMVRFACVMEGCRNAAGRGGLGAVMGSKNLKAIAARGHNLPPVVNADKVSEIRKQLTHPHPISELGTGGLEMLNLEQIGDLPVRNFRDGAFPEVENIHGGTIKETIRVGMDGCFACPVRCKKVVKFEEPYPVDAVYGGPEYETLAALGSCCGIGNLKAIAKGNERCGAYSLDTISTGSVIAFAMECFEKGLLTEKDTGGIDLRFGNDEAMLQVIDLIAHGQGIGKMLAEGTARLAKKIGKGSQDFAMNVKGLEAGMHDPRVQSGLAMSFMVSPTGADHCGGPPDFTMEVDILFSKYHPLGFHTPVAMNDLSAHKVAVVRMAQLLNIIHDSMVFCHIPGPDFNQVTELFKAVTGWDTGIPELLRVAERILTLMRLFNLREGMTEADDLMPKRFYEPTTDGALANLQVDMAALERARKYYYALMGWDTKGVPLPERLEELEIE
ncbi:aldehyde ferredoxin oxidoreductase family protein [Chloroflexota bacterium]